MNAVPAEWFAHLAGPGMADVRAATLVLLLVLAATIDVRTLRIPNWLTVGGALIGLGINAALQWRILGPHWAINGFLWALAGLGAGLVLLLPLYAFRLMGAGDVKLMAMVGAFLGFPQVLAAILSAFIAGGAVAIVFALYHRALRRTIGNVAALVQSMSFAAFAGIRPVADVQLPPSAGKLPYGVSICVGTLAWMSLKFFGSI